MPISDRMPSRGIIREVFWQRAKIRHDRLPSGNAGKESIVCIIWTFQIPNTSLSF